MPIATPAELQQALDAPLPYWKSDAPVGRSGDWSLQRFDLPHIDLAQVDLSISPDIPEWAIQRGGTYTKLSHFDTDYMSDLYEEWWSQRVVVEEGRTRGGHILISGLGLGLIIECLLRPADSPVTKITVIEKSPDVIALVAPTLRKRYGNRLEIIEADIFTWTPAPGDHFTVGWHDIWPNPHTVPREEILRLHRRFEAICDWQGSWDASCFHNDQPREVTHA